MPYEITRDYIDIGNSRSGQQLEDVDFIVSHDTGNPGSTAYANRNYFQNVQPSASAHTFIDDQTILEIIPIDEKAWHVRYEVPEDNIRYGEDANDRAIGVELAYGGKINFWEAYKRYVWYHAYLVDRYDLDPSKDIVAHSTLDPQRRMDPQNALHKHGITWEKFISDVEDVYTTEFLGEEVLPEGEIIPQVKGVSVDLPLREGDSGPFVKEIQQELIQAGFPLPRYGADGIFGEETELAVMRFQSRYGLLVDGLVGQQTLDKLKEVITTPEPTQVFELPTGILRSGDEGENVAKLQRVLKFLRFDPGSIDGIYGPLTENAVRNFQSTFSVLRNDGIYGPNTRRYLKLALAEDS